jgi:hypothetical protein
MIERCPICGCKDCCGGTLAAEKAESEYALGFAVEAVERLEAEKAVMLAALEEMADMNLCTSKGLAAIRKARGEE